MERILHILPSPPDPSVERLIEAVSQGDWVEVVCLYEDGVSQTPLNWCRLVDDIFAHEKIITWW